MDFCLNLKRDLEIHNISYLFKDLMQKKLEDFWPYSSVLPTFFLLSPFLILGSVQHQSSLEQIYSKRSCFLGKRENVSDMV